MECNLPSLTILLFDLELTLRFYNQGQVCCATTRIYVHESIKEKFIKDFTEYTLSNKVGDPFNEDTYQGPQISKVQFDRVTEYIKLGKKEGAKLVIGQDPTSAENGYFIQPHIFAEVKPEMRVAPQSSTKMADFRFLERRFSDLFVSS